MSIQIITGNCGSGKTTHLYQNIMEEARCNPKKNYIIIVPEQFTLETQRDIVINYSKVGILNIDVLSFGRLAHRIFTETGKDFDTILDDEGKNLILKKITNQVDKEKELKIFGKHLKKLGYISEIKSVISEFSQYDIDANKMLELIDDLPKKNQLTYKLEDIQKIYLAFEEYLGEKIITGEDFLKKLTGVVSKSDILQDAVIAFDGFTGFTPVQYGLIQELSQVCTQVRVTITLDRESQGNIKYVNPYELFAIGKETNSKFESIAIANKLEIDRVELGSNNVVRHQENEELSFLEQNLFRYHKDTYKGLNQSVEIHERVSLEDEVKWVAQKVRKLVKEEGYRYRDIAIIVSDIDTYTTYLNRASESYEIPIFTDKKRSLILNSFIEYLRSLLLMIDMDFGYEETFRFLKAGIGVSKQIQSLEGEIVNQTKGFGIFSRNSVDILENYVLKHGINSFKKWQKPWLGTSKHNTQENQKQYEYLNQLRLKFVEDIEELKTLLKGGSSSVEDLSRAIYLYLSEHKIQEKIEYKVEYFNTIKRLDLEKEYSQIYQVTMELLDKLVSILGDESVSLKEFIELLDAGLVEARVGVIPPEIDGVIVGDLKRTRTNDIKAMFFLGANDLLLPGKLDSKGVLCDRDRETLAANGIRLKPDAKESMYLQKYYLYITLTKPQEKLYVSYPLLTAQGKSARPSYLINDLLAIYPEIKVVNEKVDLEINELNEEDVLNYIIQGMIEPELQKTIMWQEFYVWAKENNEVKSKLNHIIQGYYYDRIEDKLSNSISKSLYGELLKNSVSRLEKFAQCPYAHFLNYGLDLKERELYEYKSSDIGNILHKALDLYAHKVKENDSKWEDISQEHRVLWAKECLGEAVSLEPSYNILSETARDRYSLKRMNRILDRIIWSTTEQLKGGNFVPEGFEVSFGFEGDEFDGIIQLDDSIKMQLRGKIDRVDVCTMGKSTVEVSQSETNNEENINEEIGSTKIIKVVDYKTGQKDFDFSELYDGTQLQLSVYLLQALEIYKKKYGVDSSNFIPGGMFYSHVQDPIIDKNYNNTTHRETVLKNLEPEGTINGNVVGHMDKAFAVSSTSGDYKSKIIPVEKKKDAYTKGSKIIDIEDLNNIGEFTKDKVNELGRDIIGGNIEIKPYKSDDKNTACTYCNFKHVCGFEPKICRKGMGKDVYTYRESLNLSKEEVFEVLSNKYTSLDDTDKDHMKGGLKDEC